MSRQERQEIGNRVRALRDRMHEIVGQESPLIPDDPDLREAFQTALGELDQRGAFEEVIVALHLAEEVGPDVERLEAALNRVGLLGKQLELKLKVIDWYTERASAAWALARNAGSPHGADPEDDAGFDVRSPPLDPDPDRRSLWKRARKLLAKQLKAIDDLFESLIKAIPQVGEPIVEVKRALESILGR